MAVDSIGPKNADALAVQKRTLEEERNRELERIERQYQDQVKKTQESRERSLQDLYESQANQVDSKQRDADRKIERAKQAADQRIKTFAEESARMAEEAQRQFQAKANNLTRNADDLDKQRKLLIAQHNDAMKKMAARQDEMERERTEKSARSQNQAYISNQRKITDLKTRGEQELASLNEEQKIRKASQLADAESQIMRSKAQLESAKESIAAERQQQLATSKENQEYQRIMNEKNLSMMQSEYDGQMRDINRGSRFEINQTIDKNRRDLDSTRSRMSDEQRVLAKQHESKLTEAEIVNQQRLGAIEDDAKLQEHMMKKSFQYRKTRFKEEADKNLAQYAEQNDKLRDELESNYRAQSANLKDKYKKQFNDQETQLQRELQHQYVRGKSQIQNIMVENAKDQNTLVERQSDAFYRVQRLNPTLHDIGEEYVVSIQMPPHEQEHVRLSHQRGQLTLSNNRRFEGTAKSEDGQVLTTNTYQSYSEALPITGRVDITKMRRSYDNGTLTFRLPKITT
jgi:HSP20 family molecular chaperone IbpA